MPTDSAEPSTIEIRVGAILQLFDNLDPFPFGERDLDRAAEEFIIGWARELPSDSPLRIVIHLPETEAATARAQALPVAITRYFASRADVVGRDLRELFRNGRQSLAVGLLALAVCVSISHAVTVWLGPGTVARIAAETLIILGWVANWRPISIFLHEWRPIVRQRNLLRRLAAAQVELRSDASPRSSG